MTWKKLHTYPKGFHLYIESLYSKIPPKKKNVDFPKLHFWKISRTLHTVWLRLEGHIVQKIEAKEGGSDCLIPTSSYLQCNSL